MADFADQDSCQAYDQDAEHNRIRARIAPMAEQVARAQFWVSLSAGLKFCGRESLGRAACFPGIDIRMDAGRLYCVLLGRRRA